MAVDVAVDGAREREGRGSTRVRGARERVGRGRGDVPNHAGRAVEWLPGLLRAVEPDRCG